MFRTCGHKHLSVSLHPWWRGHVAIATAREAVLAQPNGEQCHQENGTMEHGSALLQLHAIPYTWASLWHA